MRIERRQSLMARSVRNRDDVIIEDMRRALGSRHRSIPDNNRIRRQRDDVGFLARTVGPLARCKQLIPMRVAPDEQRRKQDEKKSDSKDAKSDLAQDSLASHQRASIMMLATRCESNGAPGRK